MYRSIGVAHSSMPVGAWFSARASTRSGRPVSSVFNAFISRSFGWFFATVTSVDRGCPFGAPFRVVKSHVRLAGVHTIRDDSGGGLMGDGVVHLVPAAGGEVPGRLRVRVIVVADLAEQVDFAFCRSRRSLARMSRMRSGGSSKIVVSERSAVLEHVVVEGESLDDVFA
jgi:hypothetical protein